MKIIHDYFTFMACVIKADRVIKKSEINAFNNIIKDFGMSSSSQEKHKKILLSVKPNNIDSIINRLAKNVSPSLIPWFIMGAFLMAAADGKISKEEIQVIKQLFEKSGFNTRHFNKVQQWGLEYVKHIQKGTKIFKLN